MIPGGSALLRRSWLPAAALAVFLVFAAFHTTVFTPLRERYEQDLRQAERLGMPLDASGAAGVPPARVVRLFAANTLDAPLAEAQAGSGVLTAALLDQTSRLAAEHGLEVRATEQNQVTQLPGSVQVRAHLKLRGRFASFVGLLDALARSERLIAVDRFVVRAGGETTPEIDLWVSQIVFKGSRRAVPREPGGGR